MRFFDRRAWLRAPLWLFLGAFVVYNANLREISSYDTMATRLVPVSLLRSFDLDMDEFEFFYDPDFPTNPVVRDPGPIPDRTPYWVQFRRGHFMPTFPVATGILAAPVYAPAVALGLFDDPARTMLFGTLLAKLSASLFAALSVAVLYLMLLRVTDRRAALWVAVIYGFATSTWAVSSQGLWQVAASQPCLVLALYGLVRARDDEGGRQAASKWFAMAGLFFALSVAARPPNALPALVMSVYELGLQL